MNEIKRGVMEVLRDAPANKRNLMSWEHIFKYLINILPRLK